MSPQGEAQGQWQREITDSVPIQKGAVLAYKKKQLVIENNTCGEQQWGPGGVSKDMDLLFSSVSSLSQAPVPSFSVTSKHGQTLLAEVADVKKGSDWSIQMEVLFSWVKSRLIPAISRHSSLAIQGPVTLRSPVGSHQVDQMT